MNSIVKHVIHSVIKRLATDVANHLLKSKKLIKTHHEHQITTTTKNQKKTNKTITAHTYANKDNITIL